MNKTIGVALLLTAALLLLSSRPSASSEFEQWKAQFGATFQS
jgi:hypothetical protein